MKYRIFAATMIGFLYAASLPAYIQIPSVTVQTRSSSIQRDKKLIADTPLQTITQKQAAKLSTHSIGELLSQTTNLVIQDLSGDHTHDVVSLRGFGDNAAQNSLILINGQPIANPDLGSPDLNLIPAENIDRIEISQNSQSILYGDQAVGGVINIITQTPTKPVKKINVSYGSFAARKIQGEIGDHFDNGLGYDLTLGHFASNHFRSHNFEQQNNMMLGLSYHHTRTQSYLDIENSDQNLQLPGALTRQQMNQNREQAENQNDKTRLNNTLLLFGNSTKLNENWHSKLDGSILHSIGDGSITLSTTPLSFRNRRDNYFFRPEVSGKFRLLHVTIKPILGLSLQKSEYQYKSALFGSTDQQNQLAAFSLLTIPLWKTLNLTAGARSAKSFDDIHSSTLNQSEGNSVLISAIGLHEHFTPYWQLYVRRAGNYRFPKVDENTNTQNNQPLKMQMGASYELGSSWENKTFSALAELYQLDLKNEIAYIPLINSPSGFGFNQNLDQTRRRGITLSLNDQLFSVLQLNFGYQYVHPKFISGPYKGNAIPNVPKQTVSFGTTVDFLQHWYFLVNAHYIGSHFSNSDVENKELFGGYTLLNAGLGYRIKWVQIILRINNLTNKQYSAQTVMSNPTSSHSQVFYYPAASINGSINLTMRL